MKFFASTLGKVALVLIALVLVAGFFQVRSCQQARQQAAQGKVDKAQDGATVGSARDSISTQGNVAANAQASEDLTDRNREDIRNAQGSDQPVNPGVRNAGFASLCKRPAFRNSPTGRVRCTPAGGVAPAR